MQKELGSSNPEENLRNSETEYSQICNACGKKPGNILITSCDHNLCLPCAARQFEHDTQNDPQNKTVMIIQKLICKVCKTPTDLEQETILELESMQKQRVRKPKESKTKPNQFPPVNLNSDNQNTKSGFCKDHPGEFLTYFCFECVNNLICSECVIHVIHHEHNVLNIKKAVPRIKTKLEEVKISIESAISKIKENLKDLDLYKKKIIDDAQLSKTKVKETFDLLVNLLKMKESELLSKIDDQYEENISDFNNILSNLNSKYNEIKNYNELLGKTISSNDIV